MSEDQETLSVKIVILGEPAVGKTTLRVSFVGSTTKESYQMTLGADIAESKIQISDQITLEAQIWDIAGQESFLPLTKQFLSGVQGAVLVFDLTRDYTFDKISEWLERLHTENPNLDNNIPFIIVGNKADLENFINTDDDPINTYIEYVNRHNVFSQTPAEYIKTSAKTGYKVKEAFRRLGEKIVENYRLLGMDLPTDTTEDGKVFSENVLETAENDSEEDIEEMTSPPYQQKETIEQSQQIEKKSPWRLRSMDADYKKEEEPEVEKPEKVSSEFGSKTSETRIDPQKEIPELSPFEKRSTDKEEYIPSFLQYDKEPDVEDFDPKSIRPDEQKVSTQTPLNQKTQPPTIDKDDQIDDNADEEEELQQKDEEPLIDEEESQEFVIPVYELEDEDTDEDLESEIKESNETNSS